MYFIFNRHYRSGHPLRYKTKRMSRQRSRRTLRRDRQRRQTAREMLRLSKMLHPLTSRSMTLGRFQRRESKWIFKPSSIYAPSSKFNSSWITRSADYVRDSLPTVSLITQCMSNLTFTACALVKYLSPGRSDESWSWRASYNLLCHQ